MTSDEAFACAPAGMDPDGAFVSCRIVATNSGPSAQCKTAGNNEDGDPCATAADCAPGLGCVATGSGASVCHPYCCGDIDACPESSYCAPAILAEDAASAKPLQIPVCVPSTPCTLLKDMSCPPDKTCTVVRGDGTTSCIDRGPGKLDEPCPCDAGYMCSTLKNKCLKLCQSGGNDCPSGMVCQGGSDSFPPNFGVCVGQHDK
jgi:hypothetical protein